jgi:purine-binding chemotaxis protein CheW
VSEAIRLARRVEELRRAFDQTFAEPAFGDAVPRVDVLAVEVGGDPYALRLAECAGLYADRPITPVPGPVPELLGLAGFRGALVPIYDLRALLGYPPGGVPRWIVALAGASSVGLAFDRFETFVRAPTEVFSASEEPGRRFVTQVARVAGATRPVLHLPSILDAIKALARGATPSPPKEE